MTEYDLDLQPLDAPWHRRIWVHAAILFVLVLAVLAPFVALAQEPLAPPPAPTNTTWLELVLQYVVAPLLPVLGALLTAALARLVAYLGAKATESRGALVAAKLAGAAQSVVAELNATLRPQLEAALADGVLTVAEKQQLKAAALEQLKTRLPKDLLAAASGIFGGFLDTYLGGLVERAVNEQKATAALGAMGRPPTP